MFMMFATVYAFPIFIEGKEKHAFEEMAKIIGITFAVQGAIHLTGFIHKPFGEMIINMCGHHEEYLKADMANIKKYRYMACSGSIFFELPGAYGAASIILFRLLLIKGQRYIYGYGPMIVIFFIIAGICLTGRTGFIGFFMGLAGYLFFVPKNFPGWNKNLKRWGIFVAVCGIIYGGFLSPKQREDFTEDLLPFAFEAYYNWRDHGKFKTGSSDVTMEVHYYPLRSETWLHGHGRSSDTTPGYYHTDAGYMDHLIFGGIFFLLALSLYQILYFIEPLSIANSRGTSESKRDFYFFMILMLHFFTIEYKGSALGIQHYTECLSLAAGLSYIIRHKYRLANELQGNS
jgi:hypothetical protein